MVIRNKKIATGENCYVIAEISHNHQGSGEKALELIKLAARAGCDAVKFQKRNNSTLFSEDFYHSEYNSENSFGKTYGEHREFLEPKKEWLHEAITLSHKLNMAFILTVFDLESLEFCEEKLNVDAYKIQSADLTFLPLIKAVAHTGKPYLISCGASSLNEIKSSYGFCSNLKFPFRMMYAVSAYPAEINQLNLGRITQLQKILNEKNLGYSCHFPANEAALLASDLGAVVIEKHFTDNKNQKGPDHFFSSTPSEMKNLIEQLRSKNKITIMNRAELTGSPWNDFDTVENYQLTARNKMGKCAVAARDLIPGHILTDADVKYVSPARGISPLQVFSLLGKPLLAGMRKNENFNIRHFI